MAVASPTNQVASTRMVRLNDLLWIYWRSHRPCLRLPRCWRFWQKIQLPKPNFSLFPWDCFWSMCSACNPTIQSCVRMAVATVWFFRMGTSVVSWVEAFQLSLICMDRLRSKLGCRAMRTSFCTLWIVCRRCGFVESCRLRHLKQKLYCADGKVGLCEQSNLWWVHVQGWCRFIFKNCLLNQRNWKACLICRSGRKRTSMTVNWKIVKKIPRKNVFLFRLKKLLWICICENRWESVVLAATTPRPLRQENVLWRVRSCRDYLTIDCRLVVFPDVSAKFVKTVDEEYEICLLKNISRPFVRICVGFVLWVAIYMNINRRASSMPRRVVVASHNTAGSILSTLWNYSVKKWWLLVCRVSRNSWKWQ